jgi:hypothetical protein
MYKKDLISCQHFNEKIPHILVIDGKKKKNIIYDVVLEDVKIVEDRILEIGTHFINKYEQILKMKDMAEIVDRCGMLSELYELELEYLYEKFNLIESYYYIYENTVEPLNAHKVAKIIIEIMYDQPKIDLTADYFANSYIMIIESLRK